MTYAAKETGLYTGNPQELYHFSYNGGSNELFYTSADENESYGGDTYTAYQISRSEIKAGFNELKVLVPTDCTLINHIGYQTRVDLTIYRLHRDDANVVVIFKGRVMDVRLLGNIAELNCWDLLKLTESPMPQYIMQTGCNWQVYSTRCGASTAGSDPNGFDFNQTINADSVSGETIESADLDIDSGTYPDSMYDAYFTAGYAEWTDGDGVVHRRFITESDCRSGASSYIKLLYPFPSGFVADESVEVYAGCLRVKGVCVNKFDNFVNFGGFPWIPGRNPFAENMY